MTVDIYIYIYSFNFQESGGFLIEEKNLYLFGLLSEAKNKLGMNERRENVTLLY